MQKLARMKTSRPDVQQAQKETVEKLTKVLDKLNDGTTNYKVDKLRGVINKKEKKILQTVTDVVTKYIDEPVLSTIIDEIINSVSN